MVETGAISNELKKLLRHSSHYLAGLLGAMALGFVSFPIFTRVFSVADYGTIDFVQKILLVRIAVSKMGTQNSALRFYDPRGFAADPQAAYRYYSTMFYGMALTAGGVSILFLAGVALAPAAWVSPPLAMLLYLVAALIFLRAMDSILWSFLRIEERTKAYNILSVATKGATIAAVCILLPLAGRSPRTFFLGMTLSEAALAGGLGVWLASRRLLHLKSFDWGLFKTAVAFGTPLVIYEIAFTALLAGDRVLVRHYLGANALGYYSVAYGLSFYVNDLLIAPLNLALLPIYLRLWAAEGRARTIEFLTLGLDLFCMVAVGVFVAAAATSRDAVVLLASAKYSGAGSLMPMLVAGLLIYTTHIFLSAGLLIQKNTREMAKLLLYSAALNIGLNCLLLPRMGLIAAPLVTLVSNTFCVLLLGRASFKFLPLRIPLGKLAGYGLAGLVAWGAAGSVQAGSVFLNVALKGALAVLVYLGMLYILDSRVRNFAALIVSRWRPRASSLAAEGCGEPVAAGSGEPVAAVER
jgi:O-antigen/teichoic acid export membrane protein